MRTARQGRPLRVGQPTLTAEEKSAEGIVGRGEGANPQSRLKARTVPCKGFEREGKARVPGSSALHSTRMKLMIYGTHPPTRLSSCALCA